MVAEVGNAKRKIHSTVINSIDVDECFRDTFCWYRNAQFFKFYYRKLTLPLNTLNICNTFRRLIFLIVMGDFLSHVLLDKTFSIVYASKMKHQTSNHHFLYFEYIITQHN